MVFFYFFQGKTLISDSGDIVDKTWRGGRVGIYVFSQENVYFSALKTRSSKVKISFLYLNYFLDAFFILCFTIKVVKLHILTNLKSFINRVGFFL